MTPPRITGVTLPFDEARRLEASQDSRDVAGIEAQVAGELARGRSDAMRELVEQACLGERPGAPVETLVQQTETLRVEAVVPANRGDRVVGRHRRRCLHGRWVLEKLDLGNYTLARRSDVLRKRTCASGTRAAHA